VITSAKVGIIFKYAIARKKIILFFTDASNLEP
jgi:hypothetical protein